MEWIKGLRDALNYIEENIYDEISIEDIAKKVCVSTFYFQKGFTMLCGFTISEYIRKRRLALAGSELASTDEKIIDIAFKYGYTSPDSFTRAFTRFHGVTPTAVRKDGAAVKMFAPLIIKFSLEGGYIMDYKIVKKEAFTIICASKIVKYENAYKEIPMFWMEHFEKGNGEVVHGMFGISEDKERNSDEFQYSIADRYDSDEEVPEGFELKVIPKHTWAVFPCRGPVETAIQEVRQKIYSEWLPNCTDYEIADGYNVEMYTDSTKYPNGVQDENYYTEIWIPVMTK